MKNLKTTSTAYISSYYNILGKIGLCIFILGLINTYNITKYGIIISIPSDIIVENTIPIIKIDVNTLKISILISSLIFFIFSNELVKNKNIDKKNSIEYEILISLGLIGLIWITFNKDIISLYLGLELYSFSYYILILVKETLVVRRISIIYLILSSLASSILLYSFYLIYDSFGSLNLDFISLITDLTYSSDYNIILYLILIGLIFKLGLIPFSYWLIRLYADLDKKVLLYQLTIPKLIFFLLLLDFYLSLSNYNNLYIYIIYIISIISIILGSIGGLFQKKDNLLLAYSSILNLGFIFLSLSLIFYNYRFNNNLDNLWINIQYFFIYFINLLGLFSALFLFNRSSYVFKFRNFLKYPFFFLSLLILIFSFIGLPPFSGFFAKFFLFFTFFTNSNLLTIISISFLIVFTLISSFIYFKFLFSSTTYSDTSIVDSNSKFFNFDFDNKETPKCSLLLSFTSLFTLTYSFFISYLVPFFYLF